MPMSPGLVVVLVTVVAAVAFGAFRAATDGRFRGTRALRGPSPAAMPTDAPTDARTDAPTVALVIPDVTFGERATLLQFSTAFCAPCRATRRVLADVSSVVPGVVHVEIDAEHHLALVRELGILRTPTTLILDSTGREVRRASGAPRKQDVVAALGEAIS
jgi:thiol-disulfide isomerase/thioredoxin